MAEYGSMLAVSLLASILFFGGWNGPIPITRWLGAVPALGWRHEYVGNVLGCINILAKGILGVTAMMWVRWTLPRLRIDQVMMVCLKYCTPIAAVMFLGASLWTYYLPGGVGLRSRPYLEIQADSVTSHDAGQAASAGQQNSAAQGQSPAIGLTAGRGF